MSTIIRAATSAEFLSLVPHLLGCTPVRSLVLVPFVGSRTLGALRADLPVEADTDDLDRIASTLIGLVCKVSHVDALALVVYTDDPVGATPRSHAALIDALLSRADICGLELRDALAVGPDGWTSYLDDAGARPHAEPAPVGGDDYPLDADQFVRAELPELGLIRTEHLARLGLELENGLADTWSASAATAALHLSDPCVLFEDVVDAEPDPDDVPRLAGMMWALQRPALRDVALTQWATDLLTGDRALDAQLAFLDGYPIDEDLAETLLGEGEVPDVRRLTRGLDVCRHVAAAAPPALRPGPLAAAAWLSWALGRSTHAGTYAAQARAIDDEHGLAGIVLALVAGQRLPEWAFRREPPVAAATSPAGTGWSRGYPGR